MVFPSGIHFTAESTEAVKIECLDQGHDALMQPGFQLSIAVSGNRHLNHMINMRCDATKKQDLNVVYQIISTMCC